jgi:hypothetical protein
MRMAKNPPVDFTQYIGLRTLLATSKIRMRIQQLSRERITLRILFMLGSTASLTDGSVVRDYDGLAFAFPAISSVANVAYLLTKLCDVSLMLRVMIINRPVRYMREIINSRLDDGPRSS